MLEQLQLKRQALAAQHEQQVAGINALNGQRDQLVANLNATIGAIAIIDEMIRESADAARDRAAEVQVDGTKPGKPAAARPAPAKRLRSRH